MPRLRREVWQKLKRLETPLRSATLTAQVPVFDIVSGLTSTIQVNLAWQSIGTAEFLHSKETFRDPESGSRSRHNRLAELPRRRRPERCSASGIFTTDVSDTATIQKQNSGTVTIEKNHRILTNLLHRSFLFSGYLHYRFLLCRDLLDAVISGLP